MKRSPWDITSDMFLSIEAVDRLLDFVRGRVEQASTSTGPAARLDQVIIESLLFSGLRNSEFCALRLGDTPVVHGRCVLEVCGEHRDKRTVHIPSDTSELICGYARDIRPLFLPDNIDPADPSQPLMLNERRRPFERTGLYRRVVRILGACGLEDRASVQLLRHTYGYLAYLRTGGNLLFVQRQLGHAHPMVTMVYAQFIDESYDNLAQRVQQAYAAHQETDSSAHKSTLKKEIKHENDERSSSRNAGHDRRHSGTRVARGHADGTVL